MSFCNKIQHGWCDVFSELYTDITTDFLSQIFGLDVSITQKKMISLLITEVPKKLNIPAVE